LLRPAWVFAIGNPAAQLTINQSIHAAYWVIGQGTGTLAPRAVPGARLVTARVRNGLSKLLRDAISRTVCRTMPWVIVVPPDRHVQDYLLSIPPPTPSQDR
jgi:hypothetical protein